ncbi:RNA polymerase, sigma subunit, ECF family [Methylocaldum marinum]|uniref:RNA polymerase, sigma subunit, ECF family n=1 Tax=Methylocaldum marinum TaxID=1432792 RepID=A0A250KXF4_9GAMM|nr:RNA polymerase sigma factor [Methylocaldum marinum]BBA36282.1 RNA polymerase, sigma subunit, ECF family [Methylocaldum marinum]
MSFSNDNGAERVRETVDAVYRSDSRRVFATLVRLLGDFDLAEEALHDAFRAALEQWPKQGVPANPRAWLVSAGRFKAIDNLRRSARFVALPEDAAERPDSDDPTERDDAHFEHGAASLTELAERSAVGVVDPAFWDEDAVEDDRLRLIFTCCHPALAPDAQVALTLREVCGLTTEEIARAFLAAPPTLAQRIVRAKAKIRDARIPYQVPAREDLPERVDAVLRVIYLVFNEGYSASLGGSVTRHDLSEEAIRLVRLLIELLPEPEAQGLLALMLLHESRRAARTSPRGELILLDEQDRRLWNRNRIEEGCALVERALSSRRFGPYTLQAAIAAVHAEAADAAETDWAQIVGLYDFLLRAEPSPVVELNRAVAVAMRDGPAAGLVLIDAILARGDLKDYHLAHAARADLCRRLGRASEARAAYQRALGLTRQEPERRFLERRLNALPD